MPKWTKAPVEYTEIIKTPNFFSFIVVFDNL